MGKRFIYDDFLDIRDIRDQTNRPFLYAMSIYIFIFILAFVIVGYYLSK